MDPPVVPDITDPLLAAIVANMTPPPGEDSTFNLAGSQQEARKLTELLLQVDHLAWTTHDRHRCQSATLVAACVERGWDSVQALARNLLKSDELSGRLSEAERAELCAIVEGDGTSVSLGQMHILVEITYKALVPEGRSGGGFGNDRITLEIAGFADIDKKLDVEQSDGPLSLPGNRMQVQEYLDELGSNETLFLGVEFPQPPPDPPKYHAVMIQKTEAGFLLYDPGLEPTTRVFATSDEATAALQQPPPEGIGASTIVRAYTATPPA